MSSNPFHSPGRHDSPAGHRRFATTSWSVVLQAGNPDNPADARDALTALCEAYWFPLYSYVRRKGNSSADAADLTQAFFAELLENESIQKADRDRGRFRNFLLASLNNFIANDWRKRQAQKRGGGNLPISIDTESADRRYSAVPGHEMTAEKIFERSWAMELLNHTMQQVRQQYIESDKEELFDALKSTITGGQQLPYSQIADQLGMKENAIKVAVHRLRQRYGEQLRMQIAKTIEDPSGVDEELKSLFQVLNPNE